MGDFRHLAPCSLEAYLHDGGGGERSLRRGGRRAVRISDDSQERRGEDTGEAALPSAAQEAEGHQLEAELQRRRREGVLRPS
ncbi:unnamed protein product [Linum tenue]|uniref:Uncharacterized protein n=1 Tax=Linum tenue TaxID=586396 RepID=A0AAV0NYU7_9ROSI|nr:unnamed protein product [Linum tenue]